jgi:hypothetical protein
MPKLKFSSSLSSVDYENEISFETSIGIEKDESKQRKEGKN